MHLRAHRRLTALFAITLAVTRTSAQADDSSVPLPDSWVANGGVYAMERSGSTLLVGGAFTAVGPPTGSFVKANMTTGAVSATWPKIRGFVAAVAPDGLGGFYVGGLFSDVGGYPRNNVARVMADGRVSTWNPGTNGQVNAIQVVGSTVYVGGKFSTVAGQVRNRLAAVDAASGVATSWNPNADNDVNTLVATGSRVFVGGSFLNVGGQARRCLAGLNTTTGAADALALNPASDVLALALDGTTLYVAGAFTSFLGPGALRNNIAAINTTTNTLLAWNPNANFATVYALAVGSSQVYAGGAFTTIGGQSRNGVAALNKSDGLATTWNPNATGGPVRSLLLNGGTLFLGGQFTTVGALQRERLAAVSTTTGLPTSWNPGAIGVPMALGASNGQLIVGGVTSVGVTMRNRLAALDVATGVPTSWNPNVVGPVSPPTAVNAIALVGSSVYFGGNFTSVGGQGRTRLASVDVSTGAVSTFNPAPDNAVYALTSIGTTLYVGGQFEWMGVTSRSRLAAFDTTTNTMTTWNPNASAVVRALAPYGTTVLVGGGFSSVAFQLRSSFAQVDALGALTSLNPGSNGLVDSIAVSGDIAYVGGSFSTFGGQPRRAAAALDLGTGSVTAWNPVVNAGTSTVWAMHTDGTTVYMGGSDITTVGGQPRINVASASAATGTVTGWAPNAPSSAFASRGVAVIHALPQRVVIGGDYDSVAGQVQPGMAAFCRAAGTPSGLTATVPLASNQVDLTWTPGAGSTSVAIHRAPSAAGPYAYVGSSSTGAFTDFTADGGQTYHYVAKDETAACEGPATASVSATTTGVCGSSPTFDGLSYAYPENPGGICGVRLGWTPASGGCGGTTTYNVYRSTNATFVPDASSLVASNVSGTTHLDTAQVLFIEFAYYYVVRASSQGVEDENEIRAYVPIEPTCTGAPMPAVPTFTARAGNGQTDLNWRYPPIWGKARVAYKVDGTFPTSPTDPTNLGNFDLTGTSDSSAQLPVGHANDTTFRWAIWTYDEFSGTYGPGRTTTSRATSSPAAFKWAYTTSASAMGRVGIIPNGGYYLPSNDNILHGLAPGAAGGTWLNQLPTAYRPPVLNAPSQGQPLVLKFLTSNVGGATSVAFVGAQDGRVYARNAVTGASLWTSNPLGTMIQAGISAVFTDYGSPLSLLFVATRESTTGSQLRALNLNGTPAWTFDNGGQTGPGAIGAISGQPQIEVSPTRQRVYFTSRRRPGGSPHTVWCVEFTAGTVSKLWSVDVGDVDSSPILANGQLYVANNLGAVYSLDPEDGSPNWVTTTGDGAVKGFVWPTATHLYFATNNNVHAIDATNHTNVLWSRNVPGASPLLVVGGRVYAGSSDGRLHSFDAASGAPGTPVPLGDPLVTKTIGAPSFDNRNSLVLAGSDEGIVYALQAPF
jgi:outer membrane protein assembly factor BamB